MSRSFKALLVVLVLSTGSCSWFLGSYDGPQTVSHGFVRGVTPGNSQLFSERTYTTVQANWDGPGGDKMWLSVNLGATHEPESSVDTDPGSAGWFFQFNRKQGYYNNGNTLTPSWTTASISENSGWELANDPCQILLGSPWRIPTIEELRAYQTAPISQGGMGEGNRTSAFNSTLKLHSAGSLHSFSGELRERGNNGSYWAADQFTPTQGEALGFGNSSGTFGGNKAFGRSVRCIKD